MTSVFISHATADRAFALRLSASLEKLGYSAWVDVHGIQAGQSIPSAVASALEQADYLVLVLSPHSVASSWCLHEWNAKYWDEVMSRRVLVLPVMLRDCVVPYFLRSKRYADFRYNYAEGLAQLQRAIEEHRTSPVLLPSADCYTDDSMNPPSRLVEVSVNLEIPYLGHVSGIWKPDEREQDAAWELYVELVTRISVVEQIADDGLLRESLTSLYSIFTSTRQLLRSYGPAVARPKIGSAFSFGYLAITMLNYVLRPVLTKWHPRLLDYEHGKEAHVSSWEHEAAWQHARQMRIALNETRLTLLDYTNLLAQISRVPVIMPELEYARKAA